MKIVWDEPKRLANIEKHGLDFADVDRFDWANAAVGPARKDIFGRLRLKAIGRFDNGVAVVIYAELGSEAISIVSFRPASVQERRVLHE